MDKWEHYLFSERERILELLYEGVPTTLRGKIWSKLARSEERKRAAPKNYYQDLLKSELVVENVKERARTQIQLDVNRTFTTHPLYTQEHGEGREKLFRVLKYHPSDIIFKASLYRAYHHHKPEVGYCQGMSYVAGMLLMHVEDEEDAFWTFVHLLDGRYVSTFSRV